MHMPERLLQADRRHTHLLLQGARIAQLDLELRPPRQWLARTVLQLQVGHLQRAALQLHRRLLDLFEGHQQLGIQLPLLQLDRHTGRQVRRIRRQIKLLNLQLGLRAVRLVEGRGHRLRGQLAAIQAHGQLGLHFHLALRGQRADEGQLHLQRFNLVLHPGDPVIQLHAAIPDLDVVERQACQPRLGVLGLGVLLELFQHIGKIPVARGILAHAHDGLVQLQRIQHRRPAQQAGGGGIDIETLYRKCGRLTRQACHFQPPHRHGQRPGRHLDAAHSDVAPQGFSGLVLHLPCNHTGQGQPEPAPNQDHGARGHRQLAPHPHPRPCLCICHC